ncbi:MAG: hypothetical protein AAFY56_01950 [Pseudomonadota bacterium]
MQQTCRALLAGLAMMSVAGPALAMPLENLYPPEEHCVFVPPPAWDLLVVLDQQQACTLETDRDLAFDAAEALQSKRRWMIQTLSPDQGFTAAFLEEHGPILQQQVRRNFESFLALWRIMRRNGDFDGLQQVVGQFRNACERGALLTLWQDGDGQARASVVSLITGNMLADGAIDSIADVGVVVEKNC